MTLPEIAPRDRDWHPPALAPAYRSSVLRAPRHAPLRFDHTASELTGPVFGQDGIGPDDADLLINYARPGETAQGARIVVHGRLLDEGGRPVPGKLIEIWQANAGGRYRHKKDGYLAPLDPNFGGCGRCVTGPDGAYAFRTVAPGPYPWPNGGNDWRPAHIHFSVFGDGFAQRLITQMYFEGDPHIPLCPIVQSIPRADAVDRLVARLDMEATVPMDIRAYRFDIVLRGRDATIFENRMEGT
ncbi:Protocatechuate 3,4-dioxygenase beta chain [Jannaschia seosinensis]|uniref:Protocatechuate 3,4-dioxygenase beta chain n=1 Tax=Jannaschia seosinensis TaxID=313367 RepID=A0A0M7B880_9RHOB|nr:protocatechuate 3,4-dioxygenase subunit beta [Jannaschia seosinensis]CUH33218.1 Protocatechuate 3,4-dioxygenase beta chain [Jannaschia seosinensis]